MLQFDNLDVTAQFHKMDQRTPPPVSTDPPTELSSFLTERRTEEVKLGKQAED